LAKVIWEEGLVAALWHTYAVKSPLVTMARPKFASKSTPSRGPIPKPHYLPYPWTRSTYDAKRHPEPIRRFSTMHWTYRQTDRRTDRPRESLIIIDRCAPRATRPSKCSDDVLRARHVMRFVDLVYTPCLKKLCKIVFVRTSSNFYQF